MVISRDLWTINYYFSLISLSLIILTDSFGLCILSLPLYLLLFFELPIFCLILCIRNICCRKRIIPGIDFAPDLHLKEHQQLLVKGDIAQGTSCPICLGELMVGQHVVFMPCGKLHISVGRKYSCYQEQCIQFKLLYMIYKYVYIYL